MSSKYPLYPNQQYLRADAAVLALFRLMYLLNVTTYDGVATDPNWNHGYTHRVLKIDFYEP
jgi:hypothetical protein